MDMDSKSKKVEKIPYSFKKIMEMLQIRHGYGIKRPECGEDTVLNEKQEKFAQAYIIHRNATEAAKVAGYSDRSAANQGYRLINNGEVKERIEDLEKELTTNIDVISEIENQYTFAKANGHTNSAIKALELLSRVRGSRGDSEKELDKKELRQDIIRFMEIIGKKEVDEIYKQCTFD